MTASLFNKILHSPSISCIIYLIISLSLLTFRFVESMKGNFGFFQILLSISLIFETLIAISMRKLKNILKDKYYLIYVSFTIIHVGIIYMDPFEEHLPFFQGVELVTIFSLNFHEIPNKFIRLIIIGFSYAFFLKKFTNFENKFEENFYFFYVIFIFEVAVELNKQKIIKKIYDTKTKSIFSDQNIELPRQNKQGLTKILDNSSDLSKSTNDSMINRIDLGIVVVNQDLQLNFCNKSFLEIFETEDIEEAKTLFFQLEENANINRSKFSESSEFTFKNIFMDTLLLPDSCKSNKDDEFSEEEERNKKSESCLSSFFSKVNLDQNLKVNFKRWKKRELSQNSDTKQSINFNRKVFRPKSVLNYLEKIFKFIKFESHSSYEKSNEWNDYFMYVDFRSKVGEKIKTSFLISFFPFDAKTNSSFTGETLITVRRLSDLEARTKADLNSKNKLLGSFCHELRTPINGLLNMLELLQSQIEEVSTKNEDFIKKCQELLLSSIINSQKQKF